MMDLIRESVHQCGSQSCLESGQLKNLGLNQVLRAEREGVVIAYSLNDFSFLLFAFWNYSLWY